MPRGLVGVNFPGKQCNITLEFIHSECIIFYGPIVPEINYSILFYSPLGLVHVVLCSRLV